MVEVLVVRARDHHATQCYNLRENELVLAEEGAASRLVETGGVTANVHLPAGREVELEGGVGGLQRLVLVTAPPE